MNQQELLMLKENLELLADGQDPKTGYPVEDSILNSTFNKRILKDAAHIIEQLLKVDFNLTCIDRRKKLNFYILPEDRKKIEISNVPIPISAFTYKINEHVDNTKMKKIRASQITSWLMKEGYLGEFIDKDGKAFKVLTPKSADIGISAQERKSEYGRIYKVNLYNEKGQQFIIDHLDDIVPFNFCNS